MCSFGCVGPCGAEKAVISCTDWVFGVDRCGGQEGFGTLFDESGHFLTFHGASLRMIDCGEDGRLGLGEELEGDFASGIDVDGRSSLT